MTRVKRLLGCIGLVVATGVTMAHHSAAMFDFSRTDQLTGLVKEIRVINPHMTLTLDVADANGTHNIDFEGHSSNNFYRVGWRPGMIQVGDRIVVKFAPRKDGHDGGFVIGFTTAQGREIGFMIPKEAGSPPATAAQPSSN
jgi:hypothetical protein